MHEGCLPHLTVRMITSLTLYASLHWQKYINCCACMCLKEHNFCVSTLFSQCDVKGGSESQYYSNIKLQCSYSTKISLEMSHMVIQLQQLHITNYKCACDLEPLTIFQNLVTYSQLLTHQTLSATYIYSPKNNCLWFSVASYSYSYTAHSYTDNCYLAKSSL